MEKIKATGFKKYLPNIATFTRLFGTFSLPFLVNFETNFFNFENVPWIWIIAYLFLVFTDSVDGILARKLHAESDFGAGIDALSDTALLVMGASTVFVKFVREGLSDFVFYLYIAALIFCAVNKLGMMLVSKICFGKPNMLHSYPQKAFAVGCYAGVAFWAFLRTVPAWSIVFLVLLNIYATIDEVAYCVRSKEYDVDFKGHGLQKYELRKK
ncbi:MAG: CDP-alcohol phosphatidyltransferase family protein [Treponema sp.]|jgi:CDP-diacylglycerol--glycerol-3-phosphate 3-phosphatidyltransferase|nr:CDP-alcohol phosphatidyltransferase family protein [Treponema sp.]